MAFGWAGAGAGAQDALQSLIARRMAEQLEQARLQATQTAEANRTAMAQEQMALQRRGFEANEKERQRVAGRQATLDAQAVEDRDVAAADRRQTQNQRGVRSMILEGLRAKTTDPRTAQLMAAGEGVEIDPDVLDPDKEQRDRLAQIQEQGRQSRMTAGVRVAGDTPQQEWVIRDGTVVPIPKGTARPGDQPYDPVAARSSKPENQEEAIDTAREVQRLSGALGNNNGFSGVFGKYSAQVPGLLASQDAVDARTILNSLKGLLTMENMGKMKGVLSDSDMRILQQASTTLAAEMSEDAARNELNRLGRVMSKLTGDQWQDIGGVPASTPGIGRSSGAGPVGGGSSFRVVRQR